MRKEVTIKYSDFPEVKEINHDEILDIINSGKKITSAVLSRYLKISEDSAGRRLKLLESKGLINSKVAIIEDSLGRINRGRIFYKK